MIQLTQHPTNAIGISRDGVNVQLRIGPQGSKGAKQVSLDHLKAREKAYTLLVEIARETCRSGKTVELRIDPGPTPRLSRLDLADARLVAYALLAEAENASERVTKTAAREDRR